MQIRHDRLTRERSRRTLQRRLRAVSPITYGNVRYLNLASYLQITNASGNKQASGVKRDQKDLYYRLPGSTGAMAYAGRTPLFRMEGREPLFTTRRQ